MFIKKGLEPQPIFRSIQFTTPKSKKLKKNTNPKNSKHPAEK